MFFYGGKELCLWRLWEHFCSEVTCFINFLHQFWCIFCAFPSLYRLCYFIINKVWTCANVECDFISPAVRFLTVCEDAGSQWKLHSSLIVKKIIYLGLLIYYIMWYIYYSHFFQITKPWTEKKPVIRAWMKGQSQHFSVAVKIKQTNKKKENWKKEKPTNDKIYLCYLSGT